MTATLKGLRYWDKSTDDEGHVDYNLVWNVETDGPYADPTFAAGLPAPGSTLSVGGVLTNPWAFYQRKGSAKLRHEGKHFRLWDVTTLFTTRPNRRCQTDAIEDPLLEPHKIRGGQDTFQREAIEDKDGNAILNAAGQRFRGPAVQIEDGYSTFEIEQNVAWINVDVLGDYVYAVNNAAHWGLGARTIRCRSITWEEVLYGTCYFYFKVTSGFQINKKTWDLKLLEEGDVVLIKDTNPPRFKRAKDEYEENLTHVLLDANGNALAPGDPEVYTTKRVRAEKDFSAAGWPATLFH